MIRVPENEVKQSKVEPYQYPHYKGKKTRYLNKEAKGKAKYIHGMWHQKLLNSMILSKTNYNKLDKLQQLVD